MFCAWSAEVPKRPFKQHRPASFSNCSLRVFFRFFLHKKRFSKIFPFHIRNMFWNMLLHTFFQVDNGELWCTFFPHIFAIGFPFWWFLHSWQLLTSTSSFDEHGILLTLNHWDQLVSCLMASARSFIPTFCDDIMPHKYARCIVWHVWKALKINWSRHSMHNMHSRFWSCSVCFYSSLCKGLAPVGERICGPEWVELSSPSRQVNSEVLVKVNGKTWQEMDVKWSWL